MHLVERRAEKRREPFWDNFKGILIFLVVFGHFLYSYSVNLNIEVVDKIFTFIYLFHMPAFIFVSGYFSKSNRSRSAESLLKLILYYIIFNTLMMLFAYIYLGASIKLLTPYYSYWYILSLVVWRFIIKYVGDIKGIVPIVLLICLLAGFSSEFSNLLSIRRTVAFFIFFLLGYLLDKENTEKFINSRNYRCYAVGLLLIVSTILLGLYAVGNYDFTLSMLLMGTYNANVDILYRLFVFVFSCLMIVGFLLLLPSKNIPFLTKMGKNSLLIYLAHRFVTLIFAEFLPYAEFNSTYWIWIILASFLTCLIFASDRLNIGIANGVSKLAKMLLESNKKYDFAKTTMASLLVLVLCINPLQNIITAYTANKANDSDTIIEDNVIEEYILSSKQKADINNSIVISYVGDMILLKNQVISAYDQKSGTYNFDKMFEHAAPYLSNADLAIGVLEGPLAGADKGYSTSNYGDGISLYLNFPDEFALAAKNAGIDLVTTANNHLLDMGVDGAMRTLDVLDQLGIMHTGSYRNAEEKDNLLVLEVEGVKIAVLSYLTDSNYYNAEKLAAEMPWLTSIMPKTTNKYYDELIKEIENDFEAAKSSDADVIMVLAHMGSQFKTNTNAFQKKFNAFFADLGADIILGDHARAVQPIEYIGDTLVVNCPGNFANSYIEYNGDATSIVEIYINKDSKQPIASSVIPMYTQEVEKDYFRAVPIYSIMTNDELYSSMFNRDLIRIKEIHEFVTDVMLNESISIEDIRERYFFIDNQYYENSGTILDSVHDYSISL